MKWIIPLVALMCGFVGGWFLTPKDDAPENGPEELLVQAKEANEVPRSVLVDHVGGELIEASESAVENGLTEAWLESLESLDEFDRMGEIYLRVKRMRVAEFPKMLDELGAESGWQVRSMIATRWADVDPQGLLAYTEVQPTKKRWSLINALFSAWGRSNPEAALTAAKQLGSRNVQDSAVRAMTQGIAKDDPRRAVSMLTDEMGANLQRNSWVLRNVYAEWARQDPAMARAAALALEDGLHKRQALSGVMSEWLAEDPMQALEWLDSLPVDSAVHESHRQIFQELMNRDFELARGYVESKVNPLERRKVLEGLYFHNLAWQKDEGEMREIYNWLGTVATGQMYDRKVSEYVRSLASVDPEGTREFVLELPAGNARLNALGAIAGELARIDPEGAIAFAQNLEYSDERQRVMSSMGWQLTQAGVVDAGRIVAASDDPEVQQQLAYRIAGDWSEFDTASSLEWARSLSDENARLTATQVVLKNWVQSDPDAAFAYVGQVTEDPSRQAGIYQSIFNDWAREDPKAAVAELDRLPEEENFEKSNQNIYRNVANAYVQHDPMAASEWISSLDSGPARDESVQALVKSISRSDPEAGFIWAATVDDAKVRKNSLHQSLREWAKSAPDAANRAISDADLPAAEKEGLFKVVENQRPKN
ncbi:MAG: hypothetical protein ACPGJU_02490 [Coraliomargarita sp.]